MSEINYSVFFDDENYINKRIPAKKWINTEMTDRMKKLFDYYYADSRILYSMPINGTELLIIEVEISVINRHYTDFISIIHRSMPYPILLFLNYKDDWFKASYTLAHVNKKNSYREVIDNITSSGWIQRDDFEVLVYNLSNVVEANEGTREDVFKQVDKVLHKFDKPHRYTNLNRLLEKRLEQYNILSESGHHFLERLSNIVGQLTILRDISKDNDYYLTGAECSAVLSRFEEDISHINDEMEYSVYDLTREYSSNETQDDWCDSYTDEGDFDYEITPSENLYSDDLRYKLSSVFNDYSEILKESVDYYSEHLAYFFDAYETLECLTSLIKDMQNWSWG